MLGAHNPRPVTVITPASVIDLLLAGPSIVLRVRKASNNPPTTKKNP